MTKAKPNREIKVPRKVAVRRSATKTHVNKYQPETKKSNKGHGFAKG